MRYGKLWLGLEVVYEAYGDLRNIFHDREESAMCRKEEYGVLRWHTNKKE